MTTENKIPLAAAFQASGLTQRQLAAKLKTGETQVSRWVRGGRTPSRLWRVQIARALGRRPDEIAWEES